MINFHCIKFIRILLFNYNFDFDVIKKYTNTVIIYKIKN